MYVVNILNYSKQVTNNAIRYYRKQMFNWSFTDLGGERNLAVEIKILRRLEMLMGG